MIHHHGISRQDSLQSAVFLFGKEELHYLPALYSDITAKSTQPTALGTSGPRVMHWGLRHIAIGGRRSPDSSRPRRRRVVVVDLTDGVCRGCAPVKTCVERLFRASGFPGVVSTNPPPKGRYLLPLLGHLSCLF